MFLFLYRYILLSKLFKLDKYITSKNYDCHKNYRDLDKYLNVSKILIRLNTHLQFVACLNRVKQTISRRA